jgi:ribosome-binding protein aMBF1 (putative translation factor)
MEKRKTDRRTFEAYMKERLQNPRFRKAWEKVENESKLTTRLVQLRVEQGLTQSQVAEMLGTKQTVISRLEHNPPDHPTDLLKRVAALYGYRVVEKIEFVRDVV